MGVVLNMQAHNSKLTAPTLTMAMTSAPNCSKRVTVRWTRLALLKKQPTRKMYKGTY